MAFHENKTSKRETNEKKEKKKEDLRLQSRGRSWSRSTRKNKFMDFSAGTTSVVVSGSQFFVAGVEFCEHYSLDPCDGFHSTPIYDFDKKKFVFFFFFFTQNFEGLFCLFPYCNKMRLFPLEVRVPSTAFLRSWTLCLSSPAGVQHVTVGLRRDGAASGTK